MNVNINPEATVLPIWHGVYPQEVAEKHRDIKLSIPAHLRTIRTTNTAGLEQDLFCYKYKENGNKTH